MEQWKQIEGYENYYVSDHGRAKVIKPSGELILKPKLKYARESNRKEKRENTGYLTIVVSKKGKKKDLKLHILVAKAFIPNPENKPQVNHKDGIKNNCDASNLEWTSHIENQVHATEHGLRPVGEKNGQAKLTTEMVVEIKRLLNNTNLSNTEIAKMYNVHKSVISSIKRGKTWNHL